jgi:hypothetical protein
LLLLPEGKRPLGRRRCRWEDGIRIDLREIGWGGCGLDLTGSGWLVKAYDSVRREVLYNILIEFGIPRKLVGLIKMC